MSVSDLPESLNLRSPVELGSINNNSLESKGGPDGGGHNTPADNVSGGLLEEHLNDLANPRVSDDSEDKENENAGSSNTAQQRWFKAYRAVRKGSDDGDVFTPDKFNGIPRKNHDILAESPMLPARTERRETLGSLSDRFNQIKLEDELTGSPMIHSIQKRNVAMKLVTEARDSSASVSTPTDLLRIRAVSPPPPSKLEFSHASTKPHGDHKRSLFDSPAPGPPKVQVDFIPAAALLDFEEVHSICEHILNETLDIIFPQESPISATSQVKSLRSLAKDKLGIQLNIDDGKLLCTSRSTESNLKANVQGQENAFISDEDTNVGVMSTSEVQCENTMEGVLNQTQAEEDIYLKFDNYLAQKRLPTDLGSTEAVEDHEAAPVLKSPYKMFEEPTAPKLKKMSRHSSLKSLKSPSVSGGAPKSVKFCEEPPTKISPKSFEETNNENDLDFLLKKISSMRRVSETDAINTSSAEASFALPSKLDLPDLSHDNFEVACDGQIEEIWDGNSINFNFQDDHETERSVLASHGGDFTLSYPKMDSIQTSRREISNEESTRTVLHHQETLLIKDKQISALGEELLIKEAERVNLIQSINAVEESNGAMELVLEECERTITQLGFEKERELSAIVESKEKAAVECEQAKEDLQAVDRALRDTSRRYERTKNQIGLMKDHENRQKEMVTAVQGQLKKEQERYEILKANANDKLSNANAQLAEIQSSKEAEILKLRSMLKKAEVEVSSLDKKADKLGRENEELTKICDELISKC